MLFIEWAWKKQANIGGESLQRGSSLTIVIFLDFSFASTTLFVLFLIFSFRCCNNRLSNEFHIYNTKKRKKRKTQNAMSYSVFCVFSLFINRFSTFSATFHMEKSAFYRVLFHRRFFDKRLHIDLCCVIIRTEL